MPKLLKLIFFTTIASKPMMIFPLPFTTHKCIVVHHELQETKILAINSRQFFYHEHIVFSLQATFLPFWLTHLRDGLMQLLQAVTWYWQGLPVTCCRLPQPPELPMGGPAQEGGMEH